MKKTISRRALLSKGLQLSIGGSVLLTLGACGDSDSPMVCADESAMTLAEKSLRLTLEYTETSPDPTKTCSDCEFFKLAAGTAGCGSCEMFGGKPANSGGHCVSWSVDPKDET